MTGYQRAALYLIAIAAAASLVLTPFLWSRISTAVEGNRATICGLVTLLSGATVQRQPGQSLEEYRRGLRAFADFFHQIEERGVDCGKASDRLRRVIRNVEEQIAGKPKPARGGANSTTPSASSQSGPPQGGHGGNGGGSPNPGPPGPPGPKGPPGPPGAPPPAPPTVLDPVCHLVNGLGIPLC